MIPLLLLAAAVSAQTLEDGYGAAAAAAKDAAARPAVIVDPGAIGAWYRKIASADDVAFDGVSARGILPRPTFDPARMHAPAPGEPAWTEGPLDSPGVYIGVHAAGREVDAGLKWSRRLDERGRDTGLFAWRVFWRVASPAGNSWHNPPPGTPEDLYLEPGARFAMTLSVRPDGTARLDVRGEGAGSPSTYAVFPLDGFWDENGARLPRRFKRVHSIDQFVTRPDGTRKGNEGAPAKPTRAAVADGRWDAVTLLGPRPAPLTGALAVDWRGGDEAAVYPSVFPGAAAPDARGGEPIVITPPRP